MSTSFPLDQIKVVLFESIHQNAADALSRAGYNVELLSSAYQGQDLVKVAGDAHIIGIRSKTHVTPEFLEQASRLWAIGCFCIGTNQVDLAGAAARGIPVFNAPFSNTRSVAEKVIAEIVGLNRGLYQRSMEMHQGVWKKSASGSHEIRGRTLGIVGYGRIGSQVSVLAEAMGMRIIYFDTNEVLSMGNAEPRSTLRDLMSEADVVTLHVPANTSTHLMIREEQLSWMKPGAFLLNNARGTVVDIDALVAALKSGRLGGAAVDVFPKEPASNDEPFTSPLMGLNNVILSPHIGGSTLEAQESIADSVATRLVKLMNNGDTSTAVNVPEVALPRIHPGCHRILHFHRNVPGVLSKLHAAIARFEINIVAEYLQSDPLHGYAILDVQAPHGDDKQRDDELKAALEIDEAIRVRTLW